MFLFKIICPACITPFLSEIHLVKLYEEDIADHFQFFLSSDWLVKPKPINEINK